MASLKAKFDKAVADSKKLSEKPDNSTLLKIYALYKQASEGDVEGKRRPRQVRRLGRPEGQGGQRGDAGVRRPDRVAEVAQAAPPASTARIAARSTGGGASRSSRTQAAPSKRACAK